MVGFVLRKFGMMLLFGLLLTNAFAAKLVSIKSVEIYPGAHKTQINFNLSEKTDGNVNYYPGKKEVIVDFNTAKTNVRLNQARLKGSNIHSISSTKKWRHKVRFTIKVHSPIKWDMKFLPKKTGATLKLFIENKGKTTNKAVKNVVPPKKITKAKKLSNVKKEKIEKRKLITVVIDPGHGGKDGGARGPRGQLEKNVVLAISKKLAREINRIPGMRAVLTRTGDYYVPLRKRLRLARKGDADVFIAVHADAFYKKYVRGASIYALSQRGATSEAARWLAKKDRYSALDEIELNALQDRSRLLRLVLIDLAQTATIRESLSLGTMMLGEIDDVSRLKKKRVEQAAFVVLKSPDIPSILIETGFITNPYEEKRLADPRYQQKLADAIAKGLKKYYRIA